MIISYHTCIGNESEAAATDNTSNIKELPDWIITSVDDLNK